MNAVKAEIFAWPFFSDVAIPPAVPTHLSLLRTSYMANYTEEQLGKVLEACKLMKDKLDIN